MPSRSSGVVSTFSSPSNATSSARAPSSSAETDTASEGAAEFVLSAPIRSESQRNALTGRCAASPPSAVQDWRIRWSIVSFTATV